MTTDETIADSTLDRPAASSPRIGEVLLEILIAYSPLLITMPITRYLGEGTRASGIVGSLGIVASVILATIMLRRRGYRWADLGLKRPKSWPVTIGLAFGVLVGSIGLTMGFELLIKAMITIEPSDHSRFNDLVGNLPLLLYGVTLVWITAGFGEEMIFRGFIMNRLANAFGDSHLAWLGALLISSVLFGLIHAYQGPSGMLMTGFMGFTYGAAYLLVKRNLWVTILAHGLNNTMMFTAIYFGAINTGGG